MLNSSRGRREARNKFIWLVIKVLIVMMFLGWVLFWILRPTKVWKKFWLHLENRTSTAAFGRAGPDIFLFTFPLVLLAALGATYLQASKDENIRSQRRTKVNLLSYPILTRGPFGIVTIAELLFVTMFLGLLIWTLYVYISNDFHGITKKQLLKSGNHHKWQYKLERVGVRLGFTGMLCLALLFLPVSRGLAMLQLIGIHFEISVKYHVWIANLLMAIFTLHALCFITVWGNRDCLRTELSRWDKIGRVNLAGVIAYISGLIMWMTSIHPIRRKFFELFYYTHHLYLVFITFFLMHIDDRHFYTLLAGVFLFLLDRFLRILQSRIAVKILSARILRCKVIELTLPKHPGLKYSSTSVMFLKIPILSRLQWHPFTITSSPSVDKDRISVMIKCQGEWTHQLYNFISSSDFLKRNSTSLVAAVEGPYGPNTNYYLRYDHLILIAGGSGVTPFLSILQEIMFLKINKNSTTKVLFLFSVKHQEDLSMLNLISPTLLHQSDLHLEEFLRVRAFVTQEDQPPSSSFLTPTKASGPSALSYEVKTVHFEAKESRVPPLIGTESNIWRATLTITTFFAVMIILGILNSLFVYPKDHNSYKKYPQWGRSLFIVPAMTIGLPITVCGLAFWRWKSAMKHRGDREHSTFKMNAEIRESSFLEENRSALHLLLKAENVHYGSRPDFQDIFATYAKENIGSNVGVLACGPRQMQESVASTCQGSFSLGPSNLSTTFDFHSFNFTL